MAKTTENNTKAATEKTPISKSATKNPEKTPPIIVIDIDVNVRETSKTVQGTSKT